MSANPLGGEYSQCYALVKGRSDGRAKFIALNTQSTSEKLPIKVYLFGVVEIAPATYRRSMESSPTHCWSSSFQPPPRAW
jgi:hypothetical protein